jgi:hypothetical protein
MGGLEWPIVRALAVYPLRFIAASAAGFAAGYPLGQTLQAMLVHSWSLNWTGYWSAVATFGLSLGVPQWLIFRRRMRRASLWISFSVIGWMLSGVAWISFRPADGLDAIAYGVVTGFGLVWLTRTRFNSK